MTIDELLAELTKREVTLRADGDRLLVNGDRATVTPGLSAAIRQHKAALLAQLTDARLIALLDELGAHDDPTWPGRYAAAAIAAGLPCYDDHNVNDLGAQGWQQWAARG